MPTSIPNKLRAQRDLFSIFAWAAAAALMLTALAYPLATEVTQIAMP